MNYFKRYKIISHAKKIKLSEQERSILRSQFLEKTGLNEQLGTIGGFNMFDFRTINLKRISIAVACVFILTTFPVVYASETSLPGDLLYPVKIKINEPVKRTVYNATKNNPENFELELLENRIIEAEKLIEKGDLNEEKKTTVREAVVDQTEKYRKVFNDNYENDSDDSNEDGNKNDTEDGDKNRDDESENNSAKRNINKNKDKVDELLEKHAKTIEKINLPSSDKIKSNLQM